MNLFSTPFSVFAFLSAGAIALFSFLSIAAWAGSRAQERKAFYEADMLKRIADSTGTGGSAALEYLREQDRLGMARKREGLKLGGLVTTGVGIGVMVFLRAVATGTPVYWVGFIPVLIGLALLLYAYVLAPRTPADARS